MGESFHVCVYERCGKSFVAPVRLTDLSHRPRSETYYACPYCFSKMNESEHNCTHELKLMKGGSYEIATADSSKKSARSSGLKEPSREAPIADCPHHVGYLKTRSKDQAVPDNCLTCPKILQCMV